MVIRLCVGFDMKNEINLEGASAVGCLGVGCLAIILPVLAWLAFWGAVIYIVLHFIFKFW